MRTAYVLLIVLAMLSGIRGSYGMAIEQVGPDSAQANPVVAQVDWPVGILELVRHESRVYWISVNGNENFYFRASPEGINDLIRLFAQTRSRDHELWIKQGQGHVDTFSGQRIDYNANLHVLGGFARGMPEKERSPDTFDPTLTVWVEAAVDEVFWRKITIPDNVILHSEVAQCPLVGKAVKPERRVWFAQLQYEDGSPAADFGHGVSTKVTFWEKSAEAGINLGEVSHDGYLHAAFSEKELADLKAGAAWLTLTTGNWATEAKRDDPRLNVEKLSLDKQTAGRVKIAAPQYYYGRLLFEDGSAPVLDPLPWAGAEIRVDFSYNGSARVDSEGYFKVYFTAEQYEKAKLGKTRKNIYIPDHGMNGRSTARSEFPVSALSRDKQQAGVVKIPRPGP